LQFFYVLCIDCLGAFIEEFRATGTKKPILTPKGNHVNIYWNIRPQSESKRVDIRKGPCEEFKQQNG